MQQDSVDLDVPEEKIPKRASAEILEAERLDDLETCMVGLSFNCLGFFALLYILTSQHVQFVLPQS